MSEDKPEHGKTDYGKGSVYRPTNRKLWDKEYDRIYKKSKNKKPKNSG